MKKKILVRIITCFVLSVMGGFSVFAVIPLASASDALEQYYEIAIRRNEFVADLYNTLTPEERVFVYYMFRAGLPGNRIVADQTHRYALETLDLFETIVANKKRLADVESEKIGKTFNADLFLQDATTYMVYLWANHGPYFKREHENEKRTPSRLGLPYITPDSLTIALERLSVSGACNAVEHIKSFVFDNTFEPTMTVPDSIDKSGANFYGPGFLDADYANLSAQERVGLNKYFYVNNHNGQRILENQLYKVDGKYGEELAVSCYWLEKAHQHAQKHTKIFDSNLVKSLDYLIQFLRSGDENLFRKYSIEWLKSNSRIDYNFGFIESYDDPKGERGTFEADVTVKDFDITGLNKLLPEFEKAMPVLQAFKRDSLGKSDLAVPNASINVKLFGSGDLGPLHSTAAYCLPNYNDIRSDYGSKQIIYKPDKKLASLINPALYLQLFYLDRKSKWLEANDPEQELERDLWTLHVILHETIGHGSGKFGEHTFKTGEDTVFDGVLYKVGDTIPVTDENIKIFLAGYEHTIEELRAEIIALYISVFHIDELVDAGFLTKWMDLLGKEKLQQWLIWEMANSGLTRLLLQQEDATEISGDHARANCTILHYLAEGRGVEVVTEEKTVDDKKYTVISCRVVDLEKAKAGIEKLMCMVQTIKSTADGLSAKKLIDIYGKKIKHPEYISILKNNYKAVVGDFKAIALISPEFKPVLDEKGEAVVDVQARWPEGFVEQQLANSKLALSKEY